MKKPVLRAYVVVATDPEAEWRCVYVNVRAHSRDEAKRVGRGELARTRMDHWSIDIVVESEAA